MRLASLLAAGTVVLHELRYTVGGEGLAGHGHSYLPLAVALVAVLLTLACAGFARELWHASRSRVAPAPQRRSATCSKSSPRTARCSRRLPKEA